MEHQHPRRLYRSRTDKVFAGICGGLAEYFNVDSSILRLLLALFVVFTGFFPGAFVYILAIFIIPEQP